MSPQRLGGSFTVSWLWQQSYGLPLAAAAALKTQTSIVAVDPGVPLTGILAGFSENGPPGMLTPGVSEVAVTLLAQALPVTDSV